MTDPYPPPPGPGEPVPPHPQREPAQPHLGGHSPFAPPNPYGSVPRRRPPPTYDDGRQTDRFAIASLVVSCVSILGLCAWGVGALVAVLGVILGHVARRRIRVSGAGGSGVALAGIIVGWTIAAIGLIQLVLLIANLATTAGTS